MQDTITTIYVVCADVLASLDVQEDKQSRYSCAEVRLVPWVVALYHGGNHALTRCFLHQHHYTRNTLNASRFCRRLARVPQSAWNKAYKDQHEEQILLEAAGVPLLPLMRSNVRKPLPPCLVYLNQIHKQQVETAFSLLDRQMLKHLPAVSPQGFLLKLQAAVIALAFPRLLR